MKALLFILLCAFPLRAADPAFGTNDRVAICGDSITGAYKYAHYLSAYLQLRFPEKDLHIYCVGKGGTNIANWVADSTHTTASSNQQHYPKYIGPLQPDFALTKWGYNGSYTADVWEADYRSIITNNILPATPILLGPQPQSDTTGSGTLQSFSARMVEVAADNSYAYSDNWNSLVSIYTAATTFTAATTDICTATSHGLADGTRVLLDVASSTAPGGLADGIYYIRDATANTFKVALTEGGTAVDITSTGSGTQLVSQNRAALQYPGTQLTPEIHHSTAGHYMDTYTIISNLGWGTNVSAATINGSAGTLTSSTDCTIGSLSTNSYDGVDFTRLDARLPIAIDEEDGRTRREAIRMIPAMNGWQAYTLTVTGLTSGTYDVYINGSVVASVTHTALAAGWNMSELTTGPVWTKCQSVLTAIRNQQGIDPTTLVAVGPPNVGMVDWQSRSNNFYVTSGLRDAALISALATYQANLDTLDSAIWTAATPATLTFSLRRQGAGTPTPASIRSANRRKNGGSLQ